mgnify:CR=1 FL=1
MNKRYYEHTLPIIRGSLSNTYSVVGFIFSNRTACSRCPLHIRRAFMMDFLSVFLSFYANTKREIHSFGFTSYKDYGKSGGRYRWKKP